MQRLAMPTILRRFGASQVENRRHDVVMLSSGLAASHCSIGSAGQTKRPLLVNHSHGLTTTLPPSPMICSDTLQRVKFTSGYPGRSRGCAYLFCDDVHLLASDVFCSRSDRPLVGGGEDAILCIRSCAPPSTWGLIAALGRQHVGHHGYGASPGEPDEGRS